LIHLCEQIVADSLGPDEALVIYLDQLISWEQAPYLKWHIALILKQSHCPYLQ
jgi:hypothetical protein